MRTMDLTYKGRLDVHPYVTPQRIGTLSKMIDEANRGGYVAEEAAARLKETLSTSDAVFSLAHLMNIRNLPEYDKAPRQWQKIANVETVDDFEPVSFQRFLPNFDNLKFGKGNKGKPGVSPRVAELDTYQYAYGYKEEAVKAAIEKRGFKWGISLEAIINDIRRQIRQIPGDMLQVALDTDEFLVFDRLQSNVTAVSQLKAGVYTPTNTNVPANAPFSPEALRVGLKQVGQRKDSLDANRKVPVANQYWIVVATGRGEEVEESLELARTLIRIQDGSVTYGPQPQGYLSRVAGVIESEWIDSDTAWYAVPAAGSTRRPSLVKLQLAGRTAPEVLVNNFTGAPIRGGSASPFDLAHFDNDSVDLKLRQFTNSALLTQDQIVWSTGEGA